MAFTSSNTISPRETTSSNTYTSSSHPFKGESSSYRLLEPSFLSLESTFLPLRPLCFLSLWVRDWATAYLICSWLGCRLSFFALSITSLE